MASRGRQTIPNQPPEHRGADSFVVPEEGDDDSDDIDLDALPSAKSPAKQPPAAAGPAHPAGLPQNEFRMVRNGGIILQQYRTGVGPELEPLASPKSQAVAGGPAAAPSSSSSSSPLLSALPAGERKDDAPHAAFSPNSSRVTGGKRTSSSRLQQDPPGLHLHPPEVQAERELDPEALAAEGAADEGVLSHPAKRQKRTTAVTVEEDSMTPSSSLSLSSSAAPFAMSSSSASFLSPGTTHRAGWSHRAGGGPAEAEEVRRLREENLRLRNQLRSHMDCPICIQPMCNVGVHQIAAIRCGHLFGKSCISRWLQQGKVQCPKCKEKINSKRDIVTIFSTDFAILDVDKLDRLETELRELREKYIHEEALRNMAERKNKASEMQCNFLRTRSEKFQLKATEAERKLLELTTRTATLTSERNSLSVERAALKMEIQKLQQRVQTLESQAGGAAPAADLPGLLSSPSDPPPQPQAHPAPPLLSYSLHASAAASPHPESRSVSTPSGSLPSTSASPAPPQPAAGVQSLYTTQRSAMSRSQSEPGSTAAAHSATPSGVQSQVPAQKVHQPSQNSSHCALPSSPRPPQPPQPSQLQQQPCQPEQQKLPSQPSQQSQPRLVDSQILAELMTFEASEPMPALEALPAQAAAGATADPPPPPQPSEGPMQHSGLLPAPATTFPEPPASAVHLPTPSALPAAAAGQTLVAPNPSAAHGDGDRDNEGSDDDLQDDDLIVPSSQPPVEIAIDPLEPPHPSQLLAASPPLVDEIAEASEAAEVFHCAQLPEFSMVGSSPPPPAPIAAPPEDEGAGSAARVLGVDNLSQNTLALLAFPM